MVACWKFCCDSVAKISIYRELDFRKFQVTTSEDLVKCCLDASYRHQWVKSTLQSSNLDNMDLALAKVGPVIVAWWCHMVTQIWVNIGSDNGLVPDGTKPLPEPMLTNHQGGLLAFTWGQFHWKCLRFESLIWIWKLLTGTPYYSGISQGPMS